MIELLCPSRGRPDAAEELQQSFDHTTRGAAKLIFLLDHDDPTLDQYPENRLVGEPTGDPTGPLNVAARESTADIVGFVGDDSRCETAGWDHDVVYALREPGVFWAQDGHDKPWPSTYFVSREIVQALGWLALPTLRRGFFDAVWVNLAMRTPISHIDERIMFRHDNSGHPVDPAIIEADRLSFVSWLDTQSEKDVTMISRAVDLAHFFPRG